MGERIQNTGIRLNSLNQKINRKEVLAAEARRAYAAACTEKSRVLADKMLEAGLAYEMYFDETLRTPVGGIVSDYPAEMKAKEDRLAVRLNSLNHKINRKAMLLAGSKRAFAAAISEENWMLADEAIEAGVAYEEYLEETVRTPVGGMVSRYLVGTHY